MWTEANAVWSLDGWPGYPKTPLDMSGTFGNLENTVNAQGDGKTPAPSEKPNLDQWSLQKGMGNHKISIFKNICIRKSLILITTLGNEEASN